MNLADLDKDLFLTLNHFAADWMDPVMRFLSGLIPWLLFIAVFLYLIWPNPWKDRRKYFFGYLALMILLYALTEMASVHLFKEVFQRPRPCHEPTLAGRVRLVAAGCGGAFGFVSSHAANSFGLAMLSSLLFRRKWFTISVFVWAFLISYSRIYVGVHYPGDVLGGMLLGSLLAIIIYLISNWHISKLSNQHISKLK